MLASVVELHFSVPDDEVVRWREEAYELGLSLTTLVRARMNSGEAADSLLDEVILDAAREAARQEVRQATLGMSREDMLAAIRAEIHTTLAKQRQGTPPLEAVGASSAVYENGGPADRWRAPRRGTG